MGGRLAYLTAASTDVDAAVPYYGGGIHGQLERAAAIRCPMQFHYAEMEQQHPLDRRRTGACGPAGTQA